MTLYLTLLPETGIVIYFFLSFRKFIKRNKLWVYTQIWKSKIKFLKWKVSNTQLVTRKNTQNFWIHNKLTLYEKQSIKVFRGGGEGYIQRFLLFADTLITGDYFVKTFLNINSLTLFINKNTLLNRKSAWNMFGLFIATHKKENFSVEWCLVKI